MVEREPNSAEPELPTTERSPPEQVPPRSTLDYLPVDRELHTESVGEIVRVTFFVFVVIAAILFLACGGVVGLFRGLSGALGY